MAKFVKDEGSLKVPVKKKVAVSAKDDTVGFVLPTVKTKRVSTLTGYIMLIFGEKKIGKTSMLAESGDNTFFAFFEPGGKALSTFSHVFLKWGHFRQAVAAIIAEKPRRFNHVVIDTVDLAYKSAETGALRELGIDYAGDAAYGKGWAAIRTEFEQPIMRLVNAGIAVTFVSHAMEADVTTRGGETYNKIVATMPKQARNLVEGLVDIWGYFGYDGKDRVLTILGDDQISAGHRLEINHFKTPAGKPVRQIHMGNSPAEAWKNFNAAFNNTYTPPTKKAEEAASQPTKKVFKKLKPAT